MSQLKITRDLFTGLYIGEYPFDLSHKAGIRFAVLFTPISWWGKVQFWLRLTRFGSIFLEVFREDQKTWYLNTRGHYRVRDKVIVDTSEVIDPGKGTLVIMFQPKDIDQRHWKVDVKTEALDN